MNETVIAKGRIARFRSRFDSGWCVFTLMSGETCKGVIPNSIQVGDQVEVRGHWIESKYGRQIDIKSIIADRPADVEEIRRYLVDKIKHIDEARASLIVQQFGADTFRVFDEEPNKLLVIPGISEDRLAEIMETWKAGERRREADRYFARLGIPVSLADRVISTLGPDRAKAQVEEDPYRLARIVSGMSFQKCDEIGRAAGIEADDPRRLKAGIVSILESATNNGDCFLYKKEHEQIFRYADRWAIHPSVHADGYASSDLVDLLDEDALVITEDSDSRGGERYDRLYTKDIYLAEWVTARALLRLLNEGSQPFEIDMSSERFQQLTAGQRLAVETALKHNVMVLTGPPGTGKTFVARFLIDTLQEKTGGTVALAAPTGRAAKRMEELTGRPASTIHRLLRYGPVSRPDGSIVLDFQAETVDASLLVVDETSMLDIRLARELFKRITLGTRLILIGDPDQLPSVGPGNVLQDLLTSGVVPIARLDEIMRQKAANPLVLAAHAIRKGQSVDWDFGVKTDGSDTLLHYWVNSPHRDDEADAKVILAETKKVMRWAKSVGLDPMEHVQVLCPQKKGPLGAPVFNTMLQETLNADGFAQGILEYGKRRFVVGDRVIQTRNNYNAELVNESTEKPPATDANGFGNEDKDNTTAVFNGDIGRIEHVERTKKGKNLLVRFADLRLVRYSGEALDDLELAYAITIHKSQGSEFPVVVMPVHSCNKRMLRRNLFYTAVTRAQKICVLIGQERMAVEAIRDSRVDARNTTLVELLREEYPYRYGNIRLPADTELFPPRASGPVAEPSPEEEGFETGDTFLVRSTNASSENRPDGEDLRETDRLAASGPEVP